MTTPFMAPYAKHILVCTGHYCAPAGEGHQLYNLLPALLTRYGLLFGPQRAKRGETACLGVCQQGPIVAIYPEGLWYHSVTPELLEQIVCEHLAQNRPLADHIFHDLNAPPSPPVKKAG